MLDLAELAWRLDLYDQSEFIAEGFNVFIGHFHKTIPYDINETTWWSTTVNGFYISGTTQEGDIWSPVHRLIHRLITFTIKKKKAGDNVLNLDIFFLWCIVTLGVFCNIPHYVAGFLAERVGKDRHRAPIYGGMLITKLARLYSIFERRDAIFLTLELTRSFNRLLFKRAHIVQDNGGGNFSIPGDDLVEQPEGGVSSKATNR